MQRENLDILVFRQRHVQDSKVLMEQVKGISGVKDAFGAGMPVSDP